MKVYYEKDADLSLIKGRKVTIVGHSHTYQRFPRNCDSVVTENADHAAM